MYILYFKQTVYYSTTTAKKMFLSKISTQKIDWSKQAYFSEIYV